MKRANRDGSNPRWYSRSSQLSSQAGRAERPRILLKLGMESIFLALDQLDTRTVDRVELA